jgi:hypothetical protein
MNSRIDTLPRLHRGILSVVGAAALLMSAACGGEAGDDHDHDHDHDEDHDQDHDHGSPLEGAEAHMCGHFDNGPFQSVDAAADQANGTEATFVHSRVNVALLADGSQYSGWIHFELQEAGEYLLSVSEDVPMELIHTEHNETVSFEITQPGSECSSIAMVRVADLETGRYDVKFGPTDVQNVGWGFHEMGHSHGEDDHDHGEDDHDHGDDDHDHGDDDHDHGGG